MDLKYPTQVNELVKQANENMKQLFGLFTTVQQQVESLSTLLVDESTDTSKKVSKELFAASNKMTEEATRIARETVDSTVSAAFPQE